MKSKTVLAVLISTLCCGTAASAAQVTFASWGGAWQDAQETTAAKPFAAQSGVQVKTDTYNGGIAQLRSQVQTNNVTWDVVDMQLADAIRACDEGLLEKVNPTMLAPAKDGTPAKSDYVAGGLSDCLAGSIAWSTLITYNKDKFKGREPSKISDFFDLKNFPGKRGLRKSPEGALEWALLADGVAPADVYKTLETPAGLNRAFKKLDTIKSSIVWWETGAQPAQLLADGEVTMSSAYNGRIYSAMITDKKPFGFIWDGQVKNIEGYAIVKGSKNVKAAQDFVRYATQPDVLAKLAPLTAYGPARKSSISLVDAKVAPYLPTAPANQKGALDVDTAFWADHSDDLNQKFAVWLGQK
ncbi:putative spermidine/putrescine transport system substrate-binding protein [Paraburkholderia terricola]|uniref:ABC transporter substrate-binding protein n=1 Tax=Paraburkholderia terricola TaxID=169427 RepID=UPI002858CF53|nr:ABC transporter substrate-binding protein [Paraburkholderia terricola]MDR6496434.1 putative spermidine/putrescine transport system substrate-binding protein [Paraburkholderia terricola]